MSATTCRACGGYVGHAVPHFCDLDALAGPIRRRAFDAMDAMPPNVSAAVGVLLAWFAGPPLSTAHVPDRAPTVRLLFGAGTQTVTSRFIRAGYASPKVMLSALRLALAIRLLDAGRSATETAYALGWSSPQAFGRAFRYQTGRNISQRGGLAWEPIVDAALSPQREMALTAEPHA